MVVSLIDESADAVPLTAVPAPAWSGWLEQQSDTVKAWLGQSGFSAEPGRHALIADERGQLARVVHVVDPREPTWALAGLPFALPERSYRPDFDADAIFGPGGATRVALGWALGSYRFTRYRKARRGPARLAWPEGTDRAETLRLAEGIALTRDLVNTPAEDMGPPDLAAAAARLATRHGAKITIVEGDDLLTANFPMVHAVGRAAAKAPRLIDLTWGDESAPKLTLVGKGVCFDSGGLDLKNAGGMKLMKKDMGGAATVLGLAHTIMAASLAVRLRVLIPAVENAVAGNAFRPLDILTSRKGLTVEIGNTDAEGRLILGDALTAASEEHPDLILDLATLTGSARVALGPDLPALFTPDESLASAILDAGTGENDPLWRLPLWQPYRRFLESNVADLNNAPDTPFAGSITAALFLQEFVEPGTAWAHIDTFAWNPKARAGRPEGGEALTLLALYRMLVGRYGG
jgi:leucyl aminopeptidase